MNPYLRRQAEGDLRTSGTFIRARLFGGWNYPADHTNRLNGSRKPMRTVYRCSDLPPKPGEATAPTFVVGARMRIRDPAILDRIQIIKGWLDAKGQAQEKIYDVALAYGRTIDTATRKVKPVGNMCGRQDGELYQRYRRPAVMAVWSDSKVQPCRAGRHQQCARVRNPNTSLGYHPCMPPSNLAFRCRSR